MKKNSFLALVFILIWGCSMNSKSSKSGEQQQLTVKPKVLFVVTSHTKLGDTNKATGYWLSEVSHPWKVITDAGYEIDFVSPLGGEPQMDPGSLDTTDLVNASFLANKTYQDKLTNTLKPEQVIANSYDVIFFVGGHGVMWDLTDNKSIQEMAAAIYENSGVVAAVCHGPAGLVNIKLKNGKYLVQSKRVSAFTNEEESAIELNKVVPFSLEDALKERGAIIEKTEMWGEQVSVDGQLITGQNPQSAKGVGIAIVNALNDH